MSESTEHEKQYENLDDFLDGELGIGKTQIELLPAFNVVPENETVEARQLRIAQSILERLQQKNVLGSDEENYEFYHKQFRLSHYSPPEAYLRYPGGVVRKEDSSGKFKVLLNPMLQMPGLFKPDYQVSTILEEAIHWAQCTQGMEQGAPNELHINEHEVDAKNRIIELAGFLQLSQERVVREKKLRDEGWSLKTGLNVKK